jgi:hypothetical protein
MAERLATLAALVCQKLGSQSSRCADVEAFARGPAFKMTEICGCAFLYRQLVTLPERAVPTCTWALSPPPTPLALIAPGALQQD